MKKVIQIILKYLGIFWEFWVKFVTDDFERFVILLLFTVVIPVIFLAAVFILIRIDPTSKKLIEPKNEGNQRKGGLLLMEGLKPIGGGIILIERVKKASLVGEIPDKVKEVFGSIEFSFLWGQFERRNAPIYTEEYLKLLLNQFDEFFITLGWKDKKINIMYTYIDIYVSTMIGARVPISYIVESLILLKILLSFIDFTDLALVGCLIELVIELEETYFALYNPFIRSSRLNESGPYVFYLPLEFISQHCSLRPDFKNHFTEGPVEMVDANYIFKIPRDTLIISSVYSRTSQISFVNTREDFGIFCLGVINEGFDAPTYGRKRGIEFLSVNNIVSNIILYIHPRIYYYIQNLYYFKEFGGVYVNSYEVFNLGIFDLCRYYQVSKAICGYLEGFSIQVDSKFGDGVSKDSWPLDSVTVFRIKELNCSLEGHLVIGDNYIIEKNSGIKCSSYLLKEYQELVTPEFLSYTLIKTNKEIPDYLGKWGVIEASMGEYGFVKEYIIKEKLDDKYYLNNIIDFYDKDSFQDTSPYTKLEIPFFTRVVFKNCTSISEGFRYGSGDTTWFSDYCKSIVMKYSCITSGDKVLKQICGFRKLKWFRKILLGHKLGLLKSLEFFSKELIKYEKNSKYRYTKNIKYSVKGKLVASKLTLGVTELKRDIAFITTTLPKLNSSINHINLFINSDYSTFFFKTIRRSPFDTYCNCLDSPIKCDYCSNKLGLGLPELPGDTRVRIEFLTQDVFNDNFYEIFKKAGMIRVSLDIIKFGELEVLKDVSEDYFLDAKNYFNYFNFNGIYIKDILDNLEIGGMPKDIPKGWVLSKNYSGYLSLGVKMGNLAVRILDIIKIIVSDLEEKLLKNITNSSTYIDIISKFTNLPEYISCVDFMWKLRVLGVIRRVKSKNISMEYKVYWNKHKKVWSGEIPNPEALKACRGNFIKYFQIEGGYLAEAFGVPKGDMEEFITYSMDHLEKCDIRKVLKNPDTFINEVIRYYRYKKEFEGVINEAMLVSLELSRLRTKLKNEFIVAKDRQLKKEGNKDT